MTLAERLKSLPEDEIVYIGTYSAYIYIGTVKGAEAKLKELGERYCSKYLKALNTNRRDLEFRCRRVPESETEIEEYKQIIDRETRRLKAIDLEYSGDCGFMDIQINQAIAAEHRFGEEKIKYYRHKILNTELAITGYKRDIINLKNRIPELEGLLQRWVDFDKREIKNEYTNIYAIPPGTAIICEGEEYGELWTFAEAIRNEK